jgi:hypothetical protein
MMPLERFAQQLDRFVVYYRATRPWTDALDPTLVRRICAETLMARHRRGDPTPFLNPSGAVR